MNKPKEQLSLKKKVGKEIKEKIPERVHITRKEYRESLNFTYDKGYQQAIQDKDLIKRADVKKVIDGQRMWNIDEKKEKYIWNDCLNKLKAKIQALKSSPEVEYSEEDLVSQSSKGTFRKLSKGAKDERKKRKEIKESN